jgi:isochorismate pyruvate lyase
MKKAAECHSIEEIREEIDRVDRLIINLIGERYEYIKAVVHFKEPTKEAIVAEKRFNEVIASRRKMAKKSGLDPDMVENLYRAMMNHFIQEELKIASNK